MGTLRSPQYARASRKRRNKGSQQRPARRLLFERLEARQVLSTVSEVADWLSRPAEPFGSAGHQDLAQDVAASQRLVKIRLETTDLRDQPIDHAVVGEDFLLHVYVEDLRSRPKGIFAAYLDIVYDPALVTALGHDRRWLKFGTEYQNGKSGDFESGLIDDMGAFAGFSQLRGGEHLLFTVPFAAAAPGVVEFTGDPADSTGHDFLVFGSDSPVSPVDTIFQNTQITVVQMAKDESAEPQPESGGQLVDPWAMPKYDLELLEKSAPYVEPNPPAEPIAPQLRVPPAAFPHATATRLYAGSDELPFLGVRSIDADRQRYDQGLYSCDIGVLSGWSFAVAATLSPISVTFSESLPTETAVSAQGSSPQKASDNVWLVTADVMSGQGLAVPASAPLVAASESAAPARDVAAEPCANRNSNREESSSANTRSEPMREFRGVIPRPRPVSAERFWADFAWDEFALLGPLLDA